MLGSERRVHWDSWNWGGGGGECWDTTPPTPPPPKSSVSQKMLFCTPFSEDLLLQNSITSHLYLKIQLLVFIPLRWEIPSASVSFLSWRLAEGRKSTRCRNKSYYRSSSFKQVAVTTSSQMGFTSLLVLRSLGSTLMELDLDKSWNSVNVFTTSQFIVWCNLDNAHAPLL